jgi:vancomycin permeability regulator SanA
MKWFWRIFLTLVITGLAFLAVVFLINRRIHSFTDAKLQTSITEIPTEEPKRIAIVFGAKVWDDGSPSNTLNDRVLTSVELYRAGRVKKLLMSGDRSGENYDEPAAMKKLALSLGVPESDIILDNDGKKTYDTCYRAKEIFEVQKAILVTQDYHQARALYLCNNLGVDSIGITANRRKYVGEWYYHFREFFSEANAWFEINFLSAEPAQGQ